MSIIRVVESEAEAKALAWFLVKEKQRHLADIRAIEQDLEELKEEWGIDWRVIEREDLDKIWVKVRG